MLGLIGPDVADIDAQSVADMIAEGRFSESEFASYCETFGVPPRRADGDYNHIASQGFLDLQHGQTIVSLALPTDKSPISVYATLVEFARKHNFRLWCPMPLVQRDINLDAPGQLLPNWNQHVS